MTSRTRYTLELVKEGLPFNEAYREARKRYPVGTANPTLRRLAKRVTRVAVEVERLRSPEAFPSPPDDA